jgi:uncharacterized membrane protein
VAYCSSCGTQMEGQFCPKCGTPATGTSGATRAQPGPVVSAQPGLSLNVASALCYVFGFITGIVFLVLPPYNQNRQVRFHAFQSIFLNVVVITVQAGVTMMSIMFHTVSFSLGLMVGSLHLLVSLGFFLVWLYVMWKSYQGEMPVLPIIGPLAERQANGNDSPGDSGTLGRAA